MATSSPLDTLIDLTRSSRDNAGVALAGLRREHQQARAQLDTLIQYRDEYRRRLQSAMETGIDPDSWRNYRQFLASLENAIARSRHTLGEREARLTQGQQRWQTEQRRLNAYDTLLERREMGERRQAARREQRDTDEMSAAMLLRRRSRDLQTETGH
jgi:flagellar FliJ protein